MGGTIERTRKMDEDENSKKKTRQKGAGRRTIKSKCSDPEFREH